MEMFVASLIVGGIITIVGILTFIVEVIEENAERRKKQDARRRRRAAQKQA